MAATSDAPPVTAAPIARPPAARRRLVPISKGLALGIVLLGGMALFSLVGPALWSHPADRQVGAAFAPPTAEHPLGLDNAGVDVVALLMEGGRASLLVGVSAGLVAGLVGFLVGALAGFRGGWLDGFAMRTTDYFLAIPAIPLMILIAALWGAGNGTLILIIGLLSWPPTALVVRAQARSLRHRGYVRRAEALGVRRRTILLEHMVPHLLPLALATIVPTIGGAIFTQASLAFIGLGDPTQPSWGQMIADAFAFGATSRGAWSVILPPGIAIGAVVLATALIGAAFERKVNPKSAISHLGRDAMRRAVEVTR